MGKRFSTCDYYTTDEEAKKCRGHREVIGGNKLFFSGCEEEESGTPQTGVAVKRSGKVD